MHETPTERDGKSLYRITVDSGLGGSMECINQKSWTLISIFEDNTSLNKKWSKLETGDRLK